MTYNRKFGLGIETTVERQRNLASLQLMSLPLPNSKKIGLLVMWSFIQGRMPSTPGRRQRVVPQVPNHFSDIIERQCPG
jgi:hypothetical protein